MDCSQYKSVVSLVECLVRSAHAKSSRGHDAVSSKQFTDFSIRSILGLESDVTADNSSDSEYHSTTSSSLSPYSDRSSPPTSHRQTSAELTPYSDISSSGSDCDSEPDRMPNYTAQAPREKRQRTTFSPNEVMQLEQAFSQRPYLTQYDEKMLAQRIGITDKNVRYWFQNRRAKSRRFRREVSPVCQTTPSNCFEPIPNSRSAQPRGLRFVADRSGLHHWKHATCVSYSHAPLTQSLKDHPCSRLSTPARSHPSAQLNQFRRDVHFPFAISSSDQFKIRRDELARLARRSSRSLRSFHPYCMSNSSQSLYK
ncbi:homeobox protein vent1-like [Montipora foliosa]|uniref:homeobox protein vent1-like n=1 Tax=Montipora foliosa TaxID=591990 RepID=UPI0035F119AC